MPNSWPGNQASSTAATSCAHGISTGAPAFTTTTVLRVRGDDAADELVLATGECQRRAIEPLALDLLGRPDDDDGRVGSAGECGRALDLLIVAGVRRLEVELEADAEVAGAPVPVDLVGEDHRGLLAADQLDAVPGLRRDHDALDQVGPGGQLEALVEDLVPGDRQPVAAEPGARRACTCPGRWRGAPCAPRPRDGPAVVERAEPAERAPGPAFALEQRSVPGEEPHLNTRRLAPGNVHPGARARPATALLACTPWL